MSTEIIQQNPLDRMVGLIAESMTSLVSTPGSENIPIAYCTAVQISGSEVCSVYVLELSQSRTPINKMLPPLNVRNYH